MMIYGPPGYGKTQLVNNLPSFLGMDPSQCCFMNQDNIASSRSIFNPQCHKLVIIDGICPRDFQYFFDTNLDHYYLRGSGHPVQGSQLATLPYNCASSYPQSWNGLCVMTSNYSPPEVFSEEPWRFRNCILPIKADVPFMPGMMVPSNQPHLQSMLESHNLGQKELEHLVSTFTDQLSLPPSPRQCWSKQQRQANNIALGGRGRGR